jgi:hypothetical protein
MRSRPRAACRCFTLDGIPNAGTEPVKRFAVPNPGGKPFAHSDPDRAVTYSNGSMAPSFWNADPQPFNSRAVGGHGHSGRGW